MSPKRWTEVSVSHQEKLFFLALSLNPEKEWRSAEGLAREMNVPVIEVEKLLAKFASLGVVVQHPTNPKLWGYWEKVQRG